MRAISGVVRIQRSAKTRSCYLPIAVQDDLGLDARDLVIFYKPPEKTTWQFAKITEHQLNVLITVSKEGIDVTRVDVLQLLSKHPDAVPAAITQHAS